MAVDCGVVASREAVKRLEELSRQLAGFMENQVDFVFENICESCQGLAPL